MTSTIDTNGARTLASKGDTWKTSPDASDNTGHLGAKSPRFTVARGPSPMATDLTSGRLARCRWIASVSRDKLYRRANRHGRQRRIAKTAKSDSHSLSHSPDIWLSRERSKHLNYLVGVAGFEPAASSSRSKTVPSYVGSHGAARQSRDADNQPTARLARD